MNCSVNYCVSFLILVLGIQVVNAQEESSKFKSSKDGAVDISGFLNSTTGFLPVPIIITEPAVGYGGGLAIAYFHKSKDKKKEKGLSPTVSMVAGALTENGTWLAALAHQGSYKEDRIRYTGFVGFVSPNLTFYGGPNDLLEGKFDFEMEGFATMHEALYRIEKNTPFFAGLNYTFFSNNIGFETGIDNPNYPELKRLEANTKVGGMNASFLWDSRNNSFTPTKGIMSGLEIGPYAKALGGDTNYWGVSSRTYFYQPIVKEKLFSGFRLKVESKWGDMPFFVLPFIDLRGIPAMRYQNNNAITVETEWRWDFYKRWSAIGFLGAGEAVETYSDLGSDIKSTIGAGFRYLLAEDYGLHAGIDVARGPEIWAFNITIGSSWLR